MNRNRDRNWVKFQRSIRRRKENYFNLSETVDMWTSRGCGSLQLAKKSTKCEICREHLKNLYTSSSSNSELSNLKLKQRDGIEVTFVFSSNKVYALSLELMSTLSLFRPSTKFWQTNKAQGIINKRGKHQKHGMSINQ